MRVLKKVLLNLLLMLMVLSSAVSASSQEACLLRLTPYVDIVNDAGLYPSVMLAQELLETGNCTSPAVNYNNYWGIKCKDGYCFAKNTWEVYDGNLWEGVLLFQVFDTPREAVEAYCYKILYQREYQDVDPSGIDIYIDTLARHWATDPAYAVKIKQIISNYDLRRFD